MTSPTTPAPATPRAGARVLLLGERWWSLAELTAARDEWVIPARLPTLLPPILSGHYPTVPVELAE